MSPERSDADVLRKENPMRHHLFLVILVSLALMAEPAQARGSLAKTAVSGARGLFSRVRGLFSGKAKTRISGPKMGEMKKNAAVPPQIGSSTPPKNLPALPSPKPKSALLAKRLGAEAVKLEARHPGAAAEAARLFGENGVKTLSLSQPEEVFRLMGLARHAPDPATRKMLLETYRKSGNRSSFLKNLHWKVVAAGTLGTAAIVAAYKLSDGEQAIDLAQAQGIQTLAKENPETFANVVQQQEANSFQNRVSQSASLAVGVFLLLCLIPAAVWSIQIARKLAAKPPSARPTPENGAPSPQNALPATKSLHPPRFRKRTGSNISTSKKHIARAHFPKTVRMRLGIWTPLHRMRRRLFEIHAISKGAPIHGAKPAYDRGNRQTGG